jgi:protocatechuate 3,4-dioxygenase, beta subunit
MKTDLHRSWYVVFASVLSFGAPGCSITQVETASRTPGAMQGPFYPVDVQKQASNQLTTAGAVGDAMVLMGKVVDAKGNPLTGASIEIWQLNGHGRYHHPSDQRNKPLDPAFAGYGRTLTNSSGEYKFQTILPVWEETSILGLSINLPPHIHVVIEAEGKSKLTTQLHFTAKEPPSQRHWLDVFVPPNKALSPPIQKKENMLIAMFDFVI